MIEKNIVYGWNWPKNYHKDEIIHWLIKPHQQKPISWWKFNTFRDKINHTIAIICMCENISMREFQQHW
jgi:hypothetical protein